VLNIASISLFYHNMKLIYYILPKKEKKIYFFAIVSDEFLDVVFNIHHWHHEF